MRYFGTVLLAALLVLSCGTEEVYVDATVSQAISGSVTSETGTYRLSTPSIVASEADFLLVRDGKQLQIITADGYEDAVASFSGGAPSFLVKKWAYPYPHFRLKGYEVGGEHHEASFVIAESELPLLMERRMYDTSFFERLDIATWVETPPASDVIDKQLWIRTTVERVVEEIDPEDALEEAVGDTLTAGEEEAPTEIVRYFLVRGDVRLELQPIAEQGVNLLLAGMAAEQTPADFGGFMTELSGRSTRSATGIYGKLQLAAFDYAGKICILR